MSIQIVVAMRSEAQPLIEHFGLSEVCGKPFAHFAAPEMHLVVSGIGSHAVAAACGFLFATTKSDGVWLNVGIGGHRSLSLGTVVLANRVVDTSSGRVTYPPLCFASACTRGEVHTVARVEEHYPRDVVYDMEAAAFVATCRRFTTAELVQVIKIISDNDNPKELTRERIGQQIADALPTIVRVVDALGALAAHQPPRNEPAAMTALLSRWHFTVTQAHQLREVLRQWQLRLPDEPLEPAVKDLSSSRQVLGALRERLGEAPPL